jgi:hypothetical protein
LHPIVSADRRFVRLHFDATLSNLSSGEVPRVPITMPARPNKDGPADGKPQTFTQYIEQPRVERVDVDQTLVIPDTNTAVLSGWQRSCESHNTSDVPILSDLPYIGELFRASESHLETEHLLIFVTLRIVIAQEKEEKASPSTKAIDRPKASVGCVSARPVRCCAAERPAGKDCPANDCRTPTIPPVLPVEVEQEAKPPDEAQILRAMPPVENPFPEILRVSRDNIQIVMERLVDKVDPPRSYPLARPARMHHCQWKCTVYYNETVESVHPSLVFRSTKPKVQVLYVEKDQLRP